MDIQVIRNATLRLDYSGYKILIDPFLAAKGTVKSFAGIAPNPTVDLPCTPEQVIAGVNLVLISHLHSDHFDASAQNLLPKSIPLLCQPGDEDKIQSMGFKKASSVNKVIQWNGIEITRTTGQHGTGEWATRMGEVSGFILRTDGEPTLYWVGDTIWYPEIAKNLEAAQPDVVVTHSGGARFSPKDDPIIMDAAQTIALCQAAPRAIVVAVHLEALDHCPVTRATLREKSKDAGLTEKQLRIPLDGETLNLPLAKF